MSHPPEPPTDADDLRQAFGRAIGFTVAALGLLLGGGVLLILLAAIFFRFMFGG
jgi:hypothetical protein